jgi:hypothetical protein
LKVSGQLHATAALTLGKEHGGPGADLDAAGKRKFLTLPGLELRLLCRPPHFFIWILGGWSPYWVHSALRPLLAYCTCPGWSWGWRSWWNERFWQGTPKYWEKTCPDATLSTTNPTCQTRARTRAAAVGSQRLTASAMARPFARSVINA